MRVSTTAADPEVSVLMACHNASRWLHEASESVLGQTFRNFEFLLVDDGSADDTWSIIDDFQQRDRRVRGVRKAHSGLADSLNVGLSHARGTWIARLDADDVAEPTRLEEQAGFLRQHQDVVLLGTNFFQTDERGGSLRKRRCPLEHSDLLLHLQRMQPFFPHSSAVFRRDMAVRAGCYTARNRLSEDSDLWLRLAERGRMACLENFLVRCRKHPEQISNSRAAGISQLVYGIAAAVCHFLRVRGHTDPSTASDAAEWERFVAWVDARVETAGVPDAHEAWAGARARYFAASSKATGVVNFASSLLRSGQAGPLVREKLFGLSLPRDLADEWMSRTGE